MKLFGLEIKRAKKQMTKSSIPQADNSITWEQLNDSKLWNILGLHGIDGDKLNEATYLTCRKKLGEAVGKLPLKIYKETEKGKVKISNSKYNILKIKPNRFMDSAIFWNTIIGHIMDCGNAYVYIDDRNNKLDLKILDPLRMRIYDNNIKSFNNKGSLWYIYSDIYSNQTYKIHQDEILHFRSGVSLDGITGLSIPELLSLTINGSLAAQSFINKTYKNGLSGKVLIENTVDLNPDNLKLLKEAIEESATAASHDSPYNFVPLPPGVKANPLGVKLTDAQFLELKKYTALQIAAAFGITPDQINNYEKSSYSSSEAQQHAFYVETLMYLLKHLEDELTSKVLSSDELYQGITFKFNVDAILRSDIKSRAEAYSKLVSAGVYTPAEAREKEDLPYKEGSDVLLINSTLIKINDAKSVGDRDNG